MRADAWEKNDKEEGEIRMVRARRQSPNSGRETEEKQTDCVRVSGTENETLSCAGGGSKKQWHSERFSAQDDPPL